MKYKPSTSIKVLVAAALILPLGVPAHAYHEKQQSKRILAESGLIDSATTRQAMTSYSPKHIKGLSQSDLNDLVSRTNRFASTKMVYQGKSYSQDEWNKARPTEGKTTASLATAEMDCHGVQFHFDTSAELNRFKEKTKEADARYFEYQRSADNRKNLHTEKGRAKMCEELYSHSPSWRKN